MQTFCLQSSTIKVSSLPCDFLSIFFSLASFIVRVRYVTRTAYRMCISKVLRALVRLPSIVSYSYFGLGESKVTRRFFDCAEGQRSQTLTLSKGQLYIRKHREKKNYLENGTMGLLIGSRFLPDGLGWWLTLLKTLVQHLPFIVILRDSITKTL